MNWFRAHLPARWLRSLQVLRAARVKIEVFGSQEAHSIQAAFMERHPRLRLVARKRWGVALLLLPETFDGYLAGRAKQAVRTNRRRAEKKGYRYAQLPSLDYLDDIVEINRSAPVRQGRPMGDTLVDRETMARALSQRPLIHGILGSDGRLRAYIVTLDLGDALLLSLILGHADALEDGVMYLLLSEVVRSSIEGRRSDGSPHWLMYDTFWGATPGLAYFKERMGFEPRTVKWVWVERELDPRTSAIPSRRADG
jgi:hypothetical protein